MPVGVTARLTVKPELGGDFERTFLGFQQQVRESEPGCIYFHLHRSRSTAGEYLVMEQYRDQAAYEVHQNTDHYKAIPDTFGHFMAGPPVIEVFDSV